MKLQGIWSLKSNLSLLNYSELKRRLKLREKEKKQKEKEDKKKAEEEKKGGAASKNKPVVEMDPTQYTESRKAWLDKIKEENKNPYPHKFQRTLRIDEYNKKYSEKEIANSAFLEDVTESITGRVYSIREASSKLVFIDIHGDDAKVQIFATLNAYKGDFEFVR